MCGYVCYVKLCMVSAPIPNTYIYVCMSQFRRRRYILRKNYSVSLLVMAGEEIVYWELTSHLLLAVARTTVTEHLHKIMLVFV